MRVNEKINKLLLENPDAQIKFLTNEDVSFYEHYSLYIDESNTSVTLEKLAEYDGKLLDEDDVYDEVFNRLDFDVINDGVLDTELEEKAKEEVETYKFEKTIVVRLYG